MGNGPWKAEGSGAQGMHVDRVSIPRDFGVLPAQVFRGLDRFGEWVGFQLRFRFGAGFTGAVGYPEQVGTDFLPDQAS